MIMKFAKLSILLLIMVSYPLLAQDESDVLRLSRYYPGGTARSVGMNGAFGALGADMSSLSINPAGIGQYRVSEFTITPTYNSESSASSFYNNNYTDSKVKFNLNNIGYVYTFNTQKEEGWVSASFGIAYNRLADFNRNITIKTTNPKSSLLDEFIMNGNSLPRDWTLDQKITDLSIHNSAYELLAWDSYALFYDKTSKLFLNDFKDFGYNQNQQRIISTKGGIGEYAFSFGANYSHKFYLGATIGVQRVDYEEIKTHSESNINGTELNSFNFTSNFNMNGNGYNLKIGAIYKPIDLIRLGLAFHTPTYFHLDSKFYTTMTADFLNAPPDDPNHLTHQNAKSDEFSNNYNISNPMKIIGSVAIQIQQFGLISVDYEYIDYTKGKIRSANDSYSDINDNIQTQYKSTGNLKLGGELKLGEFALRAGYGLYGNPYKSGTNFLNSDAKTFSYSTGFGYRGKNIFFDLGYIMIDSKYKEKLYQYEDQNNNALITTEASNIHSKFGRVVATIGFRF